MVRRKSVCMPDSEYASVSVRKIENGYVISKTYSGPKGYSSKEEFSATKPKLDMAPAKDKSSAAAKPVQPKPKSPPNTGSKALSK